MKSKICKILIFVLLILGINYILNYILSYEKEEGVTRYSLHEFYNMDNDSVDTLFVGASHFYRGVNCEVLSNETSHECYSLSSPAQPYAATYYLLKEALKYQKNIEHVYLLIAPSVLSKEYDQNQNFMVIDNMKLGMNKFSYVLNAIPTKEYELLFMPVYRTYHSLYNPDVFQEMARTLAYKDEDYRAYRHDNYLGRGHWKTEGVYDNVLKNTSSDLYNTVENFTRDHTYYLNKCVEYCKENEIDLKLLIMPYSDILNAANMEDHAKISLYFEEYSKLNDIGFEDFNKISYADMGISQESFKDQDHLNYVGAESFSHFLGKYIEGDAQYTKYKTVKDRLASESKEEIYGVLYDSEQQDGATTIWIKPYCSDDKSYLWTISVTMSLYTGDEKEKQEYQIEVLKQYDGKNIWTYEVPDKYKSKKLHLQITATDKYGDEVYASEIRID